MTGARATIAAALAIHVRAISHWRARTPVGSVAREVVDDWADELGILDAILTGLLEEIP
ncbi:MAG: hypothetical protein L3J96_02170 [Thermoplasmata archaeon]|nr:hypothetical protein [Thermoplasmata archaeon]